ncbi:3'-5' exonuclease [Alicyclobacillus dauci]|uniref:3'-5' exonuclease n=1 Tax=Alicyclobacillus dauci TaxID=1475485 RepID=A0ABY6ZAR6_9BACL|nr:3'-5' exonuclease [Alicyclobacillus dauci]WAH39251.1 3'-5' exonuclease [Alicyclobacillus dauci]
MVLDTETTGIDPAVDKVVDISLVEVSRNGIKPLYNTLIHPNRDIPPTASAVHHITLKHVADKPLFEEVWPTVMGYLEDAVIVAHNAQFDRAMIPETGQPWVCSYRLARHLWPDAPAHSNQVLRYWMNLDIEAEAAHSAAGDTLVTAHVLPPTSLLSQAHCKNRPG